MMLHCSEGIILRLSSSNCTAFATISFVPTRPSTSSRASQPDSLSQKLARLGLKRALDFALHLPLRYEDETCITPIVTAHAGQFVQVQVRVLHCEVQFRPKRMLVLRVEDESGELQFRFLNFYASQLQQFQRAEREALWLRARGELREVFRGQGLLEMIHPKVKLVTVDTPLPQTLTPIYPSSAGISQNVLRPRIQTALQQVSLSEVLPAALLVPLRLMPLADAVMKLHYPVLSERSALMDKSHPAWQRIKFEELLAQQLSLKQAQSIRRSKHAPVLAPSTLSRQLLNRLPFALTSAQQRVIDEISHDLQAGFPMTRLLQGDVGAGKTIVAAIAALQAVESGYQAAIMAPTEILAEQHVRKMTQWLQPLGIRLAWLSGSLRAREKREVQASIASGEAQLVVGTHALFQDKVEFSCLGLVVVDEQHRFGVGQRLALRDKTERYEAHQLMMSATPIPRTLAMTYFADLDVSVIDQLPPGRTPVLTKLIEDQRRHEVIQRVREAVQGGRQVYWVCPLIEESEALQLQTAVETHANLTQELPSLSVGLVHGRLAPAEKQKIMEQFSAQAIQVLVATTVIEVGVDVPNASLMVIEHAERFGLSQLHQLRGRVGRGAAESVCVLMYAKPLSATAKARLRIMHDTTDGFEIARRDLELRGPGEFLGARQSGVPLLRFADLQNDGRLVEQASSAAQWLLQHHPDAAQAHLERWLAGREIYLKV